MQHVKDQEGIEEQKTKKDATGNGLNLDTLLLHSEWRDFEGY